jgi:hypothetical protein
MILGHSLGIPMMGQNLTNNFLSLLPSLTVNKGLQPSISSRVGMDYTSPQRGREVCRPIC